VTPWQSVPVPVSEDAPTQIWGVTSPWHSDTHRPPPTQAARPGVHGKPQRGSPTPHGATVTSGGAVNFAVFSSGATAVSLVFADAASGTVTGEIALDAALNRTARPQLR
jgi:hypothetical protein